VSGDAGIHYDILPAMFSSLMHLIRIALPVFLIAGVGFGFARLVLRKTADASGTEWLSRPASDAEREQARDGVLASIRRALQQYTFLIAGPAFVLLALLRTDMGVAELGIPALFAVTMYALLAVCGILIARLLRWPHGMLKAAVLALASTNCANYGLPIVLFAFGDEGMLIGTMFVVTHILLHMTAGVMVAAWDTGRPAYRQLLSVFRSPYAYAIVLAWAIRATSATLPLAIERSLSLLGDTWIPLMLILLGVELAAMKGRLVWRPCAILSLAKLTVPVLLAFALTSVMGITGLTRAVLILQGSMPTAVNGLLVAKQFDARPDVVASVLLATTLGSVLLLSLLLTLLRV
jgi:malate permease and related proteins